MLIWQGKPTPIIIHRNWFLTFKSCFNLHVVWIFLAGVNKHPFTLDRALMTNQRSSPSQSSLVTHELLEVTYRSGWEIAYRNTKLSKEVVSPNSLPHRGWWFIKTESLEQFALVTGSSLGVKSPLFQLGEKSCEFYRFPKLWEIYKIFPAIVPSVLCFSLCSKF